MAILALILVILVAAEHVVFGCLEMFGGSALQARLFGFNPEEIKQRATRLALKNLGIYNLLLGLIFGHLLTAGASHFILAGMMGFIVIAGIYGGATVTRKIWLIQALPALVTLILLLL